MNWLKYENLDFGVGYNQFFANYSAKASRCSSSARLEVRLDDVNSEAVCVLYTPATNSDNWNNYETVYADIEEPITGVHDVYIYMLGEPDSGENTCIGNFDYFGFVEAPVIEAAGITLSDSSITVKVGSTASLTASIVPDNTADKSVTWTSSNNAVATVVDGTVTAAAQQTTATPTVTNGTATVNGKTVLYVNGKQVTGTQIVTVSGKTYAVVGGYVKTGKKQVVKIGGKYYIVNASGVVQKGTKNKLIKVGTKSYVVNKNGVVQRKASGNKLVKVGTKSYIVNKLGVVQKGTKNKLIKIGKKAYVVNKKGVVQKNKKSIKVGKKTYKTSKKGVATLKK